MGVFFFAFPVASWKYFIHIGVKQCPLIRKVMYKHLFKRHFIQNSIVIQNARKLQVILLVSLMSFLLCFSFENLFPLSTQAMCSCLRGSCATLQYMAITVSSAYVQSCLSCPCSAGGESGRPHLAIASSCWRCRDYCADVFWWRSFDSLMLWEKSDKSALKQWWCLIQ